MYISEKTEGRTEGWRKDGQKDGRKDGLEDRETITTPDKPFGHDYYSNKTFAYICKGINHISQSLFNMTLNT